MENQPVFLFAYCVFADGFPDIAIFNDRIWNLTRKVNRNHALIPESKRQARPGKPMQKSGAAEQLQDLEAKLRQEIVDQILFEGRGRAGGMHSAQQLLLFI